MTKYPYKVFFGGPAVFNFMERHKFKSSSLGRFTKITGLKIINNQIAITGLDDEIAWSQFILEWNP